MKIILCRYAHQNPLLNFTIPENDIRQRSLNFLMIKGEYELSLLKFKTKTDITKFTLQRPRILFNELQVDSLFSVVHEYTRLPVHTDMRTKYRGGGLHCTAVGPKQLHVHYVSFLKSQLLIVYPVCTRKFVYSRILSVIL
jgi:hypothetical protein